MNRETANFVNELLPYFSLDTLDRVVYDLDEGRWNIEEPFSNVLDEFLDAAREVWRAADDEQTKSPE